MTRTQALLVSWVLLLAASGSARAQEAAPLCTEGLMSHGPHEQITEACPLGEIERLAALYQVQPKGMTEPADICQRYLSIKKSWEDAHATMDIVFLGGSLISTGYLYAKAARDAVRLRDLKARYGSELNRLKSILDAARPGGGAYRTAAIAGEEAAATTAALRDLRASIRVSRVRVFLKKAPLALTLALGLFVFHDHADEIATSKASRLEWYLYGLANEATTGNAEAMTRSQWLSEDISRAFRGASDEEVCRLIERHASMRDAVQRAEARLRALPERILAELARQQRENSLVFAPDRPPLDRQIEKLYGKRAQETKTSPIGLEPRLKGAVEQALGLGTP